MDAAVNFNIYLDRATGLKLQKLAKRRKLTRNALIRRAVQDLVQTAEQSEDWSQQVLDWAGDPGIEAFESHRRGLGPAADDPLA